MILRSLVVSSIFFDEDEEEGPQIGEPVAGANIDGNVELSLS